MHLTSGYSGIFGLIVLIADIYAIISVLGSGETTGKKLIWVILIILLPVLGWILWFFAGPRSVAR